MTRVFERRANSHQFLCLILAALMGAGPTTTVAAQQPTQQNRGPAARTAPAAGGQATVGSFDLRKLAPGAVIIVALRPAQVLNSPMAEMFPIEVLQAASLRDMGLDPLAAEEVIISGSPPTSYAIYARFNQPVQLKPGPLTAHTQPAQLEGRTYLQSRDPMMPGIYMPDDRTLVAAPDYVVKQLAAAKAPTTWPLADKFAQKYQGDDAMLLVDVGLMRPLINMALSSAETPPGFEELRDIPGLIKTVEAQVNLSRPGPTELAVTADNEAGAQRLVQLVESLKTKALAKFDEEVSKEAPSDDPVAQAMLAYQKRVNRRMQESFKLEQQGDRLIIFRADSEKSSVGHRDLLSVATIGILVALLLPAIQAAREAARRNASLNNMKQIMIALLNHEAARMTLPAHASYDAQGKPLLSWRVHILPFVEESTLYSRFHLDEPWDSEHNRQLISQMPQIYLDPSSRLTPADGKTHYLGVTGAGMTFDGTPNGRKLASIRDGLSNTIAVVQVSDEAAQVWTKPGDWQPEDLNLMNPFKGPHPGGFIAGFCDGHIQFISQQIDQPTFKSRLMVDDAAGVSENADPLK